MYSDNSSIWSLSHWPLQGIGAPFIAGGLSPIRQHFNAEAARIMSAFSLLIASPFTISLMMSNALLHAGHDSRQTLSILSIVAAFVIGCIYVLWLIFKFKSNPELFKFDEEPTEDSPPSDEGGVRLRTRILFALVVFAVLTLTVLCAQCLIDNVPSLVINTSVTRTFIGGILLPLVINLSNFMQACRVSRRSRMDLVINLTLGTSVEIILLTLPLLVIIGWIMGHRFLLDFGAQETIVLLMSVYLVTNIALHGKSNYLQGVMCLGLWVFKTPMCLFDRSGLLYGTDILLLDWHYIFTRTRRSLLILVDLLSAKEW